jgi:predicted DsbA family dithiol-disulfide isomerase
VAEQSRPTLLATVFSDYICPFCYIGDLRLDRLREYYQLKINWMLIEIHPDTPPEGTPVSKLGYSDALWQQMMENLGRLAAEEGVILRQPEFNVSSRKALLLAEAAKGCGSDVFYHLHRRLFEAYFRDGRNIGEEGVLRELARACGVPDDTVTAAWNDPVFATRLQDNLAAAAQVGVRATPTVFFSAEHRLDGALPYCDFETAAQAGWQAQQSGKS